jgi:hypothetical protein
MAWSAKGSRGPSLLIIRSFYRHKLCVALRRVQATTLLHQVVVAVGEASSKLGVLPSFSLISLHNLLRATCDRFRS